MEIRTRKQEVLVALGGAAAVALLVAALNYLGVDKSWELVVAALGTGALVMVVILINQRLRKAG